MSVVDYEVPEPGASDMGAKYPVAANTHNTPHPLHRLSVVRRRQGVSRRAMARRLKTDVDSIARQEKDNADILLSTLYEWQDVLRVPVAELLVDTDEPLSPPVMKRAQMVRLMKTAAAILERAQKPALRRMAQMMVDQLIEIMPELEGVSPWNAVGQRRTLDELGKAADRCLSLDALADFVD